MNKKVKKSTAILFTIIITAFSYFSVNNNVEAKTKNNSVNLVWDTPGRDKILPKHFRKTSNLKAVQGKKNFNINGLDRLNISGSQQFSEYNLPILIKAIGTKLPITIIDLRQESHGFINGLSVSWADSNNNANAGLTRAQVLEDEADKLESIKLWKAITFYNRPLKRIVPVKVENENELVISKRLAYKRIPVRDGGIPSDYMVDYFIDIVKNQPKNSWIHFHCKQGVGRTTLFMIMYDMVKNAGDITEEDIIERQLELGNVRRSSAQSFRNEERKNFLRDFYEYSKANKDVFKEKWSEWIKAKA